MAVRTRRHTKFRRFRVFSGLFGGSATSDRSQTPFPTSRTAADTTGTFVSTRAIRIHGRRKKFFFIFFGTRRRFESSETVTVPSSVDQISWQRYRRTDRDLTYRPVVFPNPDDVPSSNGYGANTETHEIPVFSCVFRPFWAVGTFGPLANTLPDLAHDRGQHRHLRLDEGYPNPWSSKKIFFFFFSWTPTVVGGRGSALSPKRRQISVGFSRLYFRMSTHTISFSDSSSVKTDAPHTRKDRPSGMSSWLRDSLIRSS